MQPLQFRTQRDLRCTGRNVIAHTHGNALQPLAAKQARGSRGVGNVDRRRGATGECIGADHADHLDRHAAQQHRAADRVAGEQRLRGLLVDHAHRPMRLHLGVGEEPAGPQAQPAHARQISTGTQHLRVGAPAALQCCHRTAQVGADTVHVTQGGQVIGIAHHQRFDLRRSRVTKISAREDLQRARAQLVDL